MFVMAMSDMLPLWVFLSVLFVGHALYRHASAANQLRVYSHFLNFYVLILSLTIASLNVFTCRYRTGFGNTYLKVDIDLPAKKISLGFT